MNTMRLQRLQEIFKLGNAEKPMELAFDARLEPIETERLGEVFTAIKANRRVA